MGHKPKFVILLAEDEPLVRNLVRTVLTRAGYVVLDASDGGQALELSRQHNGSIHMLLTDIKMPTMNGIELSTQLRKDRPGIKILLMSGKTSGEMLIRGQSVDFLRKPFLPKALLAKLSDMLAG
jgi:two-component system, cell cycle sensor histidine kinase and response regulator CckA